MTPEVKGMVERITTEAFGRELLDYGKLAEVLVEMEWKIKDRNSWKENTKKIVEAVECISDEVSSFRKGYFMALKDVEEATIDYRAGRMTWVTKEIYKDLTLLLKELRKKYE